MFKGEKRLGQKRETEKDKHLDDIEVAKLKSISFIESVNVY